MERSYSCPHSFTHYCSGHYQTMDVSNTGQQQQNQHNQQNQHYSDALEKSKICNLRSNTYSPGLCEDNPSQILYRKLKSNQAPQNKQ